MKKEKTKRNKILGLLLGLVIFTGLSSVASTFAWWNLLKHSQPVEITVGERITLAVSTDDVLDGDGYLIPKEETPLANQVHYVTTKVELNIIGNDNIDSLQLKVTDEDREFKTVSDVDKTATYKDYFVVKVDDTEVSKTKDLVYINTDLSISMEVDIEFSIMVPNFNNKTDAEKEIIATDLSKGVFTITLGFELLKK